LLSTLARVHTTPAGEIQNALVILDLCLRKTSARKSRDYIFSKSSVFKTLSVHTQADFFKFSGMEKTFEKLRFRDGLGWTEELTIEIKMLFQISSVWFMDGVQ